MEMLRSVQASTKSTMDTPTLAWMLTPILLVLGIGLIVIGFLIIFGVIPTNTPSNVNLFNAQLDSSPYNQTTGYQTNAVRANQQYLVNYSPLTGYLAGYIGPIKGGSFDANLYLSAAFKAGIRSFVLPISTYNDNNKTPDRGWPYSGNPAIVCRDISGTIISSNGMSIRDFVQGILQNRGVNSFYANEPIYLFLEEVPGYVPDRIKEERAYVSLMNKMANELSILDNTGMRIIQLDGFGQLGTLVGGEKERELLTSIPVQNFYNKIIIFTNFNTRLASKSAYTNVGKTLHEYANFIYTSNTSTSINANQASKSILIKDLSGSQVNWLNASQANLYIAETPYNIGVPSTSDVNTALAQGVQIVPIPFLFNSPANTRTLYSLWKGASAIVKPVPSPDQNLFTRPDPVVPAQPSQVMNARVSPNQQPGQILIR
jgi:hypothetical protein